MCKEFKLTPKELGKKRRDDRDGITFLEQHMVYRWTKERQARQEAERKARAKSHRRK